MVRALFRSSTHVARFRPTGLFREKACGANIMTGWEHWTERFATIQCAAMLGIGCAGQRRHSLQAEKTGCIAGPEIYPVGEGDGERGLKNWNKTIDPASRPHHY